MGRAASHPIIARGLGGARATVAALIAVTVLAACGSSSSQGSSGGGSSADGNGVASKSPAQIVAAAQAALRSAHSFVAAGTLSQGGQTLKLQIVNGGGSTLRMQINQSGKTEEIIATSGAGYVRANRQFWSAQAGALASRLANRWIQLPASASKNLSSGLGQFAPGTLARCLGENLGTLSPGGRATVGGQQAVVVRQAGNAPGSNPGTLAVATTGPAYPLRLTSTGPTRSGGKVDACNDGKGGDVQGTLVLRDFDHAPAVITPKHAVKIGGLSGSSA
jgi:hypothetical protein